MRWRVVELWGVVLSVIGFVLIPGSFQLKVGVFLVVFGGNLYFAAAVEERLDKRSDQ